MRVRLLRRVRERGESETVGEVVSDWGEGVT
jgi:hypothetical protein